MVAILLAMPIVAHIYTVPFFLFSNMKKADPAKPACETNATSAATLPSENATSTKSAFEMTKSLWNSIEFHADVVPVTSLKVILDDVTINWISS